MAGHGGGVIPNLSGVIDVANNEKRKFKEGDDVDHFVDTINNVFEATNIAPSRRLNVLKLHLDKTVLDEYNKFVENFEIVNPNPPTLDETLEWLEDTYQLTANEKKTRHAILTGLKQGEFQTVDTYFNSFNDVRRRALETPEFIAIEYFKNGLRPDIKYYVTVNNNPVGSVREAYLQAKDIEQKIINGALPRMNNPVNNEILVQNAIDKTLEKLGHNVNKRIKPNPSIGLSNVSEAVEDDLLDQGMIAAMMQNKEFLNKLAQAANKQIGKKNYVGFVGQNNGNNNNNNNNRPKNGYQGRNYDPSRANNNNNRNNRNNNYSNNNNNRGYSNNNSNNNNYPNNGNNRGNNNNNTSDDNNNYCGYCDKYGHIESFCARKMKSIMEANQKLEDELNNLKRNKNNNRSNNDSKTNSNSSQ